MGLVPVLMLFVRSITTERCTVLVVGKGMWTAVDVTRLAYPADERPRVAPASCRRRCRATPPPAAGTPAGTSSNGASSNGHRGDVAGVVGVCDIVAGGVIHAGDAVERVERIALGASAVAPRDSWLASRAPS